MKVLILSANDIKGGAARAAYRLHQGLLKSNVDSQMLVQGKYSGDRTVIGSESKLSKGMALVKPVVDALPFAPFRTPKASSYSTQWLPDRLLPQINSIAPDVINLHWIKGGFLQIETIAKLRQPVVWTLHDMWAMTGGCHYTQGCTRYTRACGACPQLNSTKEWDLTRWVWQRKAKAWKNQKITIVTPSKWLAKCASESSLFKNSRIEVIPNGIDLERYQPVDKKLARKLLQLPEDKKIVLFGAIGATSLPRKGFSLLLSTLQKLSQTSSQSQEIELVVFGSFEPLDPPNFGFNTRYLGKLNDDVSLNLLYAAADVFVAPSLQDNFPNTILEAFACGTPCAAFNIGGIPDAVDHRKNGYLAQAFDTDELASGINWILEDRDRHETLSRQARTKVEQNFTLEIQAAKYLRVFQSLTLCK